MSRFGVVGPPTMIFFDPRNPTRPATRLIGELTLDELAATAGRFREPARAELNTENTRG
jgi:thiol:disulfide interchange protein